MNTSPIAEMWRVSSDLMVVKNEMGIFVMGANGLRDLTNEEMILWTRFRIDLDKEAATR